MNVVVLAGSNVGEKSSIVANRMIESLKTSYGEAHDVSIIDLKDYQMTFSDGRNYLDYEGDNKMITETIMAADVLMIVTPIFQASIPAVLKNVFDLLPQSALQNKVSAIVATAGSDRHYLIPEQQLKPILSYMKSSIVPNYVFLLDTDYQGGKIINDDIHFRIDKLIEDTLVLATAYKEIWSAQEESYGF
ncbi:NADPH-dependent FMN reductase [Marinilactibacillus kalidii]|uniref:NADPH-dependent FMN reductase n=1 Tax=Marinilactibacillus kalidii TaxID=2820274 RepID=UPI001ABE62B7|nr:NADPH-dependent FMN reductase [Marinilactibacillus kalidii]